jgi:phage FluMu protein Com
MTITSLRTIRCQSCDSVLWSDKAKQLRLCPECECVDECDYSDLEECLEKVLESKL